MILVELYLIKSVVAWAATIKGVQLSVASAEETFKEVRRKTCHIHATLHNVLLDEKLPADVRQAVATVQTLLQDFDDILEAKQARSALTSLPRKVHEAEELQARSCELNGALERLQDVCRAHNISIDDDIAPSPELTEDLKAPEEEMVDSFIKQKKERKKVHLPSFITSYIPTWEMLGYRCRTSKS